MGSEDRGLKIAEVKAASSSTKTSSSENESHSFRQTDVIGKL